MLLSKDKIHIPEEIYHLACQQADLGVIKLLVKHARKERHYFDQDLEEGIELMSQDGSHALRDYLFGDNNNFKDECLNNKLKLGKYMRKLHREIFDQDYKVPESNNTLQSTNWSDIGIVKAVFELQNRDKEFLDDHCMLNINLDRKMNVEMLVLANKQHFKHPDHLKLVMIAAAQKSKSEMLKFLHGEYSEVWMDESIVKDCYKHASQTSGKFLMKEFAYLSDINFLQELFLTAFSENDIQALEYYQSTISESEEVFHLAFLKELLDNAVDTNFTKGIDFLVKHFPKIKELPKTYHINYLLQKTSNQVGIKPLQCLINHFPSLLESKQFFTSRAKEAMSNGDVEKLSFFMQDIFVNVGITYEDFDLDLLMKALDLSQKPINRCSSALREAMEDLFQYKAESRDFKNCKIIIEKFPKIANDFFGFKKLSLKNEWFFSTVMLKYRQFPEQYQDGVWVHFIAIDFQEAVMHKDDKDLGFLLENFPKLQTYTQLFKGLEISVVSRVLKKFLTYFKRKRIPHYKYVFDTFEEAVKENNHHDMELFLDTFPDLILDCYIETVSSVIEAFPTRFLVQPSRKTIVEALQESDLQCISSYLTNCKVLSEDPLVWEMWYFALQNSNIDTIYLLLHVVEEIKCHSNDILIQYLLDTDLRRNDLTQAELDIIEINGKSYNPTTLCANRGALELISILIEKGAKIEFGAIKQALEYEAVVEMLLNCEEYKEEIKDKLGSLLVHAAREGHVNSVKLLLEHGTDVDSADSYNNTSLHKSAEKGHASVVNSLLEHNAQINAANEYMETALHRAAKVGHLQIVKLLLEHKAEIDATNDSMETALHLAATEGHLQIVKLLLEHNAQIDAANDSKETALHKAASRGHLETVKLLLKNGASISQNIIGDSPLSQAARNGRTKIVKLFLEQNIVNKVSNYLLKIALWRAIEAGHEEVSRLLLTSKAELTQFAFFKAVEYGQLSIVKFLLSQDCDKNLTDEDNKTSVEIAEEKLKKQRKWLRKFHYKEIIAILTDSSNTSEDFEKTIPEEF